MRYTDKYNLALPEGTDKVLVSILNENMDKVDAILTDIYSKLPTPPQPAVTEFTIDAQADLEKHWSSYSVYGGFDYALNLTLGDVWKCEFTYEGQTQELPNITVIKCSDAGITGALADNLCLADDSLGAVIDKAESAFDGDDRWQPIYNENKTAMDIMGVTDEEGQILPIIIKFTKIPSN